VAICVLLNDKDTKYSFMDMTRLEQLRALSEEDPGDLFVRYAIGLELFKESSAEEAIDYMTGLAAQHPDYCPAHFKLGQWLADADEVEAALHWLNKALQIARKQGDKKAENEIREAIWLLED
jgi:tetratricopeptide (TPR) repeat protein